MKGMKVEIGRLVKYEDIRDINQNVFSFSITFKIFSLSIAFTYILYSENTYLCFFVILEEKCLSYQRKIILLPDKNNQSQI